MSDEQIERIACDARDEHDKNGSLWDTYFYKVVLAGNADVINAVVTHMQKKNEMTETLNWLLQINTDTDTDKQSTHKDQKRLSRLSRMRLIIRILFTIINIVLTPCFYALHSISARIIPAFLTRISASIKLPLAYAAFSQSNEMIALFLSQGVTTDQVDNRGNNVFHYIADLSSGASDTAIQIFHGMVTQMKGEMEVVRELMFEKLNSAGFTAVEHVAKFGSPALLSQFLTHANSTTVFSASKHGKVYLNKQHDDGTSDNIDRNESSVETDSNEHRELINDREGMLESNNNMMMMPMNDDESNNNTEQSRPSDANRVASDVDTHVEEVDVTKFETGPITGHSSLLISSLTEK